MIVLCRKAPAPKWYFDEVLALWNEFYDLNSEPDLDGIPDEQAEAIYTELSDRCQKYVFEHLSPLAREFCQFDARCGDECALADPNGGYVRLPSGEPVQDWQVSEDRRIVDANGNQLYDSTGQPIMAIRMSDELFDLLVQDGWWPEDSQSEDDHWY